MKSSLIFAALGKKDQSKIYFNQFTRNHSELFLNYLGFNIINNNNLIINSIKLNKGFNIIIPGDISNAAFIIAAAILIPNSNITIKNLLNNKTRSGFLNVIKDMGGSIKFSNCINKYGEEICDLTVKYSPNLKNINLSGDKIITMIDEIPILAILATQADGAMKIDDAGELRIKESDRIKALCHNLTKMNADIRETKNGFILKGKKKLHNTTINDFDDHRISMSFYILNLLLDKSLINEKLDIARISFPEFHSVLKGVIV